MAHWTIEAIEANFPNWEYIKFEYGRWTALHMNYDASYEGEEDGWVDNGLMAEGRTLEDLAMDMYNIEDEKGLNVRPAYVGESDPKQCEFKLTVGDTEPLNPRLDLRNHSPTGLSWGYAGSGPAQTALAILAHATGDDQLALKHYQQFKAEVIARQPDNFILTHESIMRWLASYG